MSVNTKIKTDHRPPKGGWANGNYWNKCFCCGDMFIGDKRATSCADCAYTEPSAGNDDQDQHNKC